MKQIMKIIGMEIVKTGVEADGSDSIVKLILVPHSDVTIKKPSLMQLAMGGTDKIIQEMMDFQQNKTIIFISQREWLKEFKNQPYSNVNIEISINKLAMDIARGE
jgi:hypothetical protein